jgi:hypothetical protein
MQSKGYIGNVAQFTRSEGEAISAFYPLSALFQILPSHLTAVGVEVNTAEMAQNC